jgi:pseudaminic acid biosynthesis-associated methylase
MSKFKTDQERFWASEFGTDYIDRNTSKELYAANLNFFSTALASLSGHCKSILELGANVGMNVGPFQQLLPGVEITAVEINSSACEQLRLTGCTVIEGSILDFVSESKYDLTFTKGVLIHVNPSELEAVYATLYDNSNRYILIAEYYSPTPVAVNYRGHDDRLFKRDFAGELLDKFKDLKLVDYGFCYHRGAFPQDDITWFLLEKSNA